MPSFGKLRLFLVGAEGSLAGQAFLDLNEGIFSIKALQGSKAACGVGSSV